MTIILGIDVSKYNLDVFDSHSQKYHKFSNTSDGLEKLVQHYKSLNQPKKVIMESTAVYQRLSHKTLEQAGFEVCLINPYKSRCFAKSAGFLAKTDKVDARMLCSYGQRVDCRTTSYPSKEHEELDSLLSYKTSLNDERIRYINQLEQNHACDYVQTSIQKRLKELNSLLRELEKRIENLINAHKEMYKKREILESVPGVGKGTVATLLCYLPELDKANRKEVAVLVGVAPLVCESGQFRGRAMIKGGRAHVRKALYMPILTCIRKNERIKDFYQKLKDQGKPTKVVLTACMRKLLIILSHMLKTKTLWMAHKTQTTC